MKYSNTAITQMKRWYKGVLKKCAILNATVIACAALLAAPANAGDDTSSYVDSGSNDVYTDVDNDYDSESKEGELSSIEDSFEDSSISSGVLASDGLMPSSSPIIQAVIITVNDNMFHGVSEHLANPSAGLSSGDVLSGVTLWGDVYASKVDVETSGSFYGFDAKGKGAVIGLDKEVADDVKVGIGFQYDQTDVNAHLRDINVKTKTGFLYSEYAPSDWFVNAIVAYGHSDFSERKHPGNTYIARYDVDTYSAQAMAGYHVANSYAVITPQAGLRYNFIKREAYVDGAGQKAVKGNIDILTAIAGVKVKSRACSGFKPEAHANLTYDIVSDHGDVSVVAGDVKYRVDGKRLPRLGADVGVGVSYDLGEWNFGIGYDLGIRKDYTDHTGMLKVQYSF